ncbi:MAG: DUF1624 domain-containing protein [Cyanobacteria bacterium SBC]|nr:DUF1624 domain-containing protein [Cyanobacteria bacterium SBC]
MKQRDYSLDAIKGLGCLMMIVAHTTWSQWGNDPLTFTGLFLGQSAPLLFFAVSGITSTFQITRRSLQTIVFSYLAIGILGISYNALIRPNLFFEWQTRLVFDILQIIAIGVIVVTLFEKLRLGLKWDETRTRWIYLLLTFVAFAAHYIVDKSPIVIDFPWHFVFIEFGRVPSFPIFPWISTFFLGVYLYRSSIPENLFVSTIATSITGLYAFYYYSKLPIAEATFYASKVRFSIGYFFFSTALISIAFYVFRRYERLRQGNSLLVRFGTLSLIFLYVHWAVIFLISKFGKTIEHFGGTWNPNLLLLCFIVLALSAVTIEAIVKF